MQSWRDAEPILTLKWSSAQEMNDGLQSIVTQFPDIKFDRMKHNKIKFKELPATRVFWLKELAERVEAKIA